ncbi:aspartate-semialdehyde dehydrogenase [Bdellovibrio sp. SKB1291214]|uniref:aspartate-semialdehyde dehydrogenase n=1 Tax=Bdellovibrio sp. SKB1291214 TaxID=1732569 RepID=UPI000B51A0A0|nr:aspartate-semialdehyde dehydrogenase [Bdellovibrio sp. SKB1291214]UYL10150.1 aspartate-semialdehyde dehydrogenase [Bdellovibrio sp. SKB1291214]
MKRKLKVGVVGATGMVGQTFMTLLEERAFPISELRPFASENSLGKKIELQGQQWPCQVLKDGCFDGLDLVFFSSGDDISAEWAPKAVKAGAFAVDNSAAFRMDPNTVLIVPEVNGHLVNQDSKPQIIANPNCSTIQLVVALKPLSEKFGLDEVRVSTYQAVSGAGQGGHDELMEQTSKHTQEKHEPKTFPHTILFNCIPQIGSFNDEGFCSEEVKIMKETRKILGLPKLKVSAFTVRIPALNAHSESVWVTLKNDTTREAITEALSSHQGIVVQDDPKKSVYPLARDVSGKDPVYVGRIHRDPEDSKLWMMWVVSDNIRKGAALNGIQIAEQIFF